MYKKLSGVFKFIRAERNQGVSFKKDKENGIAYDFATIRVSDEHDSYNVDCDTSLVESLNSELKKGDFVELSFDVGERFNNTAYTVESYKKVQTFAKAN